MLQRLLIIILFMVLIPIIGQTADDPLPWANPWDVGMDVEFINGAFSRVTQVILGKGAPGAVGTVIKDGHIVARKAMGNMEDYIIYRSSDTGKISYQPVTRRMLESTLFDLASLTKMVACNTSIMILYEQGKIDFDRTVADYIPSFASRGKGKVTVRQLLTHTSGLPSWYPFYQICVNREEVFRMIDEEINLEYKPGEKRIYSDLGFITLGRLVEEISGQRLDRFTKAHIFDPLGMDETQYLPWLKERLHAAPTEYDALRDQALKGIVHDENARALGGVSGHAGLFSTANDLTIFAQMLLNKGEFNGIRILAEDTIDTMLTSQIKDDPIKNGSGFLSNRKQLLGWWGMDDAATISGIGGLPSPKAFGHSGFTGTMMYIDPENKAAAILLSNAVHPRRENAQKSDIYRGFFTNVSKALKGEKNVNIAP